MEEILDDLETMGVKALTLSGGGDPLCYRYINDLLAKIIRMGIDYAVITNGQALTGRTAEQLANAVWVRISLDSASSEHYFQMRGARTFDKVLSNIKRFAEMKSPSCELGINFVVAQENSGDVYKICETAKKIGVNNIKFSPALQWDNSPFYHQDIKQAVTEEIGRAAADFGGNEFIITDKYSDDIYFAQNSLKNYSRCYISEFFTVIAADCKVYMCHQKSYTKEGEIGDLSTRSFKELWFSKDIQEKIKKFRPDCVCDNVCAFEERNSLLNSALNADDRFINFI
jgi:MoaA/NifB/PqqE/SkfB family radical SAM enzyme